MLKTKNFYIFLIALTAVFLKAQASTISTNLEGVNLDAIELSTSNKTLCSFENVDDLEESLRNTNKLEEDWIRLIDEKLRKAEIIKGSTAIKKTIRSQYAYDNKALTISYEAVRSGISANFLGSVILYYTSKNSNQNTSTLPINKQKLNLIKTNLILKRSSFCWDENEFRANLRIFTSIFRSYLDKNSNLNEALVSYLIREIRLSSKEATLIVESIKNIENNLLQ
jgi:hypothetical protein